MIGDSITKSYFRQVDRSLKGKYCCGQLATSKCVGDPGIDKELEIAFCDNDFDIVHFNNGMHGWDYTETQYENGLEESMDWLLKKAPKAKLIWAHTTPVRKGEGFLEFNEERTDRVRERNVIATKLSKARGLEINDLFSVVVYRPEWFVDGVHFNEGGVNALAEQVTQMIQA